MDFNEIKLKLITNGFAVVNDDVPFGYVLFHDNKEVNVYIEKNDNTTDTYKLFDLMYESSHEMLFLALSENDLFGKTKMKFFRWMVSRFGNMNNARGKVTIRFGYLKNGNIIWEKVEF